MYKQIISAILNPTTVNKDDLFTIRIMKKTEHSRTRRILESYLSLTVVDDRLVRKFRAWFFDSRNSKEKHKVLNSILDSKLWFDPHPDTGVYKTYRKLAKALKFETANDPIFNFHPKHTTHLIRRVAFRIAAVTLPLAAAIVIGIYLITPVEEIPAPSTVAEQLPVKQETVNDIVVAAAADEKKHTILPDSSSVWLNSKSEIVYAEGFENQRMVQLEGEAYFNVAKSEGNPFTVVSDDLKATVLGTIFNIVNDLAGNNIISLYKGSLKVDTPTETYTMTTGQELRYNTDTGKSTVINISRTKPDWMRNIIDFRQKTASSILASLGKIYGYDMDIKYPGLTRSVLTLKLEGEVSFNTAMSIMADMNGFDYRIVGRTVEIKAKNN